MPELITIASKQTCPNCENNTMRVSMLECMPGRTGFFVDLCSECGHLRSYTITLPRPKWHWFTMALGVLVFISFVAWILL